jgi:hypothetical protein
MKNCRLMLSISSLVVLSSCQHFFGDRIVRGNGVEKTKEYSLSEFTRVNVGSLVTVHLTQGPLKPIRLVADENLLPYIQIEQSGEEIDISNKSGYGLESNKKVNVYICAPNYRFLELSGAGDLVTDSKIICHDALEIHSALNSPGNIQMDLEAPKITARVSGVGDLNLKGHTHEFGLYLEGGNAFCFDLIAASTKVSNTGIGEAEVFSSSNLDASITGIGMISYKGNPGNIIQNIGDNGKFTKIENEAK